MGKITKKIAKCLLYSSMALALLSCGNNNSSSNTDSSSSTSSSAKTEAKTVLSDRKTYNVFSKSATEADTITEIVHLLNHEDIDYISLGRAFDLYEDLRALYWEDSNRQFEVGKLENGKVEVKNNITNATATFDAFDESISFPYYEAFIIANNNIPGSFLHDYGQIESYKTTPINNLIGLYDETNCLFNYTLKKSDGISFELAKYDIDLAMVDDELYIPFATFNDVFLNQLYTPLSVLKNGLYNVYSYSAMASAIAGQGVKVTSSKLKQNYNELCFFLDTFFGLKDQLGIISFDDYCTKNDLKEQFLASSYGADTALQTLIITLLDDGHTNYLAQSPSTTEKVTRQYGMKSFYAGKERSAYQKLRNDAYPDGWPMYEEIGDTAFITFDRFSGTPDDVYETGVPSTLEEVGDNAVRLFAYAYAQINRENSPIKNVVVDESCNGGGDTQCLAYIAGVLFGYFGIAGEMVISNNVVYSTYIADANLDHKIDKDDLKMKEKNVYVLTGSTSFSCGNILPRLAKNAVNGALIGQRSGGGACVVLPASTVLGTGFRVSGSLKIVHLNNGKFVTDEDGVEVDFPIEKTQFYSNNRADLLKTLFNQ